MVVQVRYLLMGNKHCCEVANIDYKQTYPQHQPEDKIKFVKVQTAQVQKKEPSVEPVSHAHSDQPYHHEHKHEAEPKVESIIEHQPIQIPSLSTRVLSRLQEHNDLNSLVQADKSIRLFDKEVYAGQLEAQTEVPQGYGKIYKIDGSIYIGSWAKGKAEGKGVYIKNDGSFYQGQFSNNNAHGKGKFVSDQIVYEGWFKVNKFQGQGIQEGKDYRFQGDYEGGHKLKGLLVWKTGESKYVYNGGFNPKNQFHGQGTLKDPQGVYTGQFQDGEKHGTGQYKFENGLRYEGEYKFGKKCGKGTIFNFNGSIAYEGEFENDLPHGEGFIYDKKGNKNKRKWVKGLDIEGL